MISIITEGYFRRFATSLVNLLKRRFTGKPLKDQSEKYLKFSRIYNPNTTDKNLAPVKPKDLM